MAQLLKSPSLRLPSEEIERHATWLEIFFDLVFAVAVTQISERLFHELNYAGVFYAVILFVPVFWTWVMQTVYASRFDSEDIIYWIMVFVVMFAAAIMTIQIPTALEGGGNGFAIGFILARVIILLLYLRAIADVNTPRSLIWLYLIGFSLGGSFWVLSFFIDSPYKIILWIVGLCIDFSIPWVGRKRILSKVPLDPDFIPERFGSFTVIILGQAIVAVILGLTYAHWHLVSVAAGIAAFILAILIWAAYYNFILIADYKCSLRSGQPYIYGHLPLVASLVIIGVCVENSITSTMMPALYGNTHVIFCSAVLVWLASFTFIKYIALNTWRIIYPFLLSVAAVLILFFVYPLPPLWTLCGLDIIFLALLVGQYYLNAPGRIVC